MSDQTQTTEPMEPTSNQTPEPSPAEPQQTTEPSVNDPAPATYAEPMPQQQQQTTAPEPTAPEPPPAEPTEPSEPGTEARVVPKPSEYELPEGVPDNLRIFAHENGFTQEQLTASLNQFAQYNVGMQQHQQQMLRQLGEAHVKNWGPDAKHKLSLAKAAIRQNDPEGKLLAHLNNSGWANHPDVLNFLYNIGRSMQEGGFVQSAVPRRPGDKTAAQAMYGDQHPSKG